MRSRRRCCRRVIVSNWRGVTIPDSRKGVHVTATGVQRIHQSHFSFSLSIIRRSRKQETRKEGADVVEIKTGQDPAVSDVLHAIGPCRTDTGVKHGEILRP